MAMELQGRAAVIIGGNGAIGAATAGALAGAGARIILVDREGEADRARMQATLAGLPGSGHRVATADILDHVSLAQLRDSLAIDCEGVGILVNSAGFTKPIAHADLDALDDALIDDIFRVNWRAQFATIRAFAPLLKASGDGLVVSLSSIAAFTAVGSNIAYCAAKAGIDVMTKALARALAPEIRVLAVSPGVVDTAFVPGRGADFNARVEASTPLGRIATPHDIADAILACATHLRYSTGHIVQVDGGRAL
ncbi:MAG: SDR family NAD(P)-dependent oxidoreductase [Sphingobium sp.]